MADPTADEMARAVDYLRQRIDEIQGSTLDMPEVGQTVWLHTPSQIASWLDAQFAVVANGK